MDLIIQLLLIPIGFLFGGMAERKHHRSLDEREAASPVTLDIRKTIADPETVTKATMVMGQVVIATDHWKSLTTKLRNLVGGEMKAAHALMQRGRREALMRMCEAAQRRGADEVWNVRLEFSNISMMSGRGGAMQVEVIAFGTAVVRER
ncbi:MAG: heavy metal-binding domain-containing protein [Planctomycetota bacterium]